MSCFYKLVSCYKNTLMSFNAPKDKWVVQYKVGEWAEPLLKGSKLFAFKELEHVEQFLKECFHSGWRVQDVDRFKLFQCEVENPTLESFMSITTYGIEQFWIGDWSLDTDYITKVPLGTYCCDKIKLVKEIPIEDCRTIRRSRIGPIGA